MEPLFAPSKPLFADAKSAQPKQEVLPAVAQTTQDASTPSDFQLMVSKPVNVVKVAPKQVVTDEDIDNLGMKNAMGMSDISKKVMSAVKTSDSDEFGKQLNELIAQAKGLDPTKVNSGVLGKLRGLWGQTKEKILAEFSSVEARMDALVAEMDKTANLHKQRIGDFEQLFQDNIKYKQGLLADEQRAREMLVILQQHIDAIAQAPAEDVFAAQQQRDLQNRFDRLEKRADDFARSQRIADMMAPQIRMMQDNARGLSERFRDIKVTTLPAYRSAFTMFILQSEQKKGAELAEAVSDATDAALVLQGQMLRQNVVAVEKAKQRSVVSMETLKKLQADVIGAADDAKKIADEGRAQREAARPELQQLEQELIQRFGITKQ